MEEVFFTCPHCWQQISMLVDPSVSQEYIEDCEVCCNPIELQVEAANGTITSLQASPIGQ